MTTPAAAQPQPLSRSFVFKAIWPVTDLTVPMPALIAAATLDLPQLTATSRCVLQTTPRWAMRPGQDVPGSGGATVVLQCHARAVAVPRDVDAVTGSRDTRTGTAA